jgi:DNA invertase Pin-like site-specific DNA recombinase
MKMSKKRDTGLLTTEATTHEKFASGKKPNGGSNVTLVRCAIYTRKSCEEGLEQDFNSLDSQRVLAERYIQSQASKGWIVLPKHYDDGGFSGGNMDRPALQELLMDIELKKIDCVVTYKLDRVSRSLFDSTKIIHIFDEHKVIFDTVTESFSSANPSGRLILNMLLSFAQYERELTIDRVRDKFSESRKKGIWMGGFPQLLRFEDRSGRRNRAASHGGSAEENPHLRDYFERPGT